jgi:hypothetical protein
MLVPGREGEKGRVCFALRCGEEEREKSERRGRRKDETVCLAGKARCNIISYQHTNSD